MPDETKSDSEGCKHAPSVAKHETDELVERNRNALTLTPGELLTGLSVFQIDQPHQQTLAYLAVAQAREIGSDPGLRSSAIFRATSGGDVAVFTQWTNRSAYKQAAQTLLKPSEQELYQIVVVDHITGQGTSQLAIEDGLFHFINVFHLAQGRRDDFVDYFKRIIPVVRVQPGFVSTNLLISLDGRHAANIGQFETCRDFLTALRQPRVIIAFAQGFRRRLLYSTLGIIPRPPRLRLYDLLAVFC
jgi:heme-degrading monooxygenase HmoA